MVLFLVCFKIVEEIISKFVNFLEILARFLNVKGMAKTLTPGDEALIELMMLARCVDFKVHIIEVMQDTIAILNKFTWRKSLSTFEKETKAFGNERFRFRYHRLVNI